MTLARLLVMTGFMLEQTQKKKVLLLLQTYICKRFALKKNNNNNNGFWFTGSERICCCCSVLLRPLSVRSNIWLRLILNQKAAFQTYKLKDERGQHLKASLGTRTACLFVSHGKKVTCASLEDSNFHACIVPYTTK